MSGPEKTKADAKAAFYLHCRRCIEQHLKPSIESFADRHGLVWVWCRVHDIEIFHTPAPVIDVSAMRCEACEKGVEHAH